MVRSEDHTIQEHTEWSKYICLDGKSGGSYSYQAGIKRLAALLGYSRFCDRGLVKVKRKHNTIKAHRGMEIQLYELLRGQPDVPTLGTSYIPRRVGPMISGTRPAFLVHRTFRYKRHRPKQLSGICPILFQTCIFILR